MQPALTSLLNKNRHLFQLAFQYNDHIFTHAGITNAWYREFLRLPVLKLLKTENDTVADLINKVEQSTQRYLLYAVSIYSGGQSNGSPLWADKKETEIDMLPGYHQVVGHTQVNQVETVKMENRSITYVDVPGSALFYELDI